MDPGFSLGGGGGAQKLCAQKIMCPHAHYECGTEHTFADRGPCRGPLKGPGSSRPRVVLMLSRPICALFLSILIKNWMEKNIIDPIGGGGGCCTPLDPLLYSVILLPVLL